jgi:quercetin dioxygenase-like cupin family protein
MEKPALPYELNHAASPAYWQVDILWTILASGDQTGGSYSLMEELCPKDSGPPPHFHDQDEAFYIIEGEIAFAAGEQIIRGRAGSFIAIPRGVVHSFRVESDAARVLNWYAPAGFERTISELAEPAPERTLPPKGRPLAADPQKMMALFREVGMHMADGPNPLHIGGVSPQYVGGGPAPAAGDGGKTA